MFCSPSYLQTCHGMASASTVIEIIRVLSHFVSVFLINLRVRVFCLHVCVCTTYVHAWCPLKLEEGVGSPTLELQMVVSHQVGAWNVV